ncbi:MAG: ABC transporter ATP-binding protein [Spirochaetota bacterium]
MNVFEEKDYDKQIDIRLWKRLLAFASPYKKYFAALSIIMILVGLTDALFPMVNRYAIDNFIIPGKLEGFPLFTLAFVGLAVLQSINVWLLVTIAGKIDMGICYDLRKSGFKRLQELSFSYYDTTPVGWIMARMTSDNQKLGQILSWGLVDMIWGFTMMISIAVFMLAMNWILGLAVLSVMPILVATSSFFQKKILKNYRSVRKINSKLTGTYNEGIMGAKTTKTLVREYENQKEFRDLTGEMRNSSIRAALFSSIYLPIVLTLASIGTGLALWTGGSKVMAGVLSYGTLIAFLAYTVQFFEPVRELARVLAELQAAQASAERIITLIETEPQIKDKSEIITKYGDVFNPKIKNWPPVHGDVEFKNVSFQYNSGETVLSNFSLKVRQGETIALVGETGSGKSTIVNLICRFYEPTDGEILIDGVNYKERSLGWLQSHLGYVLQSPHLFSGTIKENIRYGKLDAADNEIIKAAKLVNAHNFISRMEKGYDSDVGEGGSLLSTGEKQLISFARAVLADPPLFILDEATSSVDTETEQIIQQAIHTVLEDRTSFIIAHRLSTIKSADRILVIHNGQVIEEGNHHTLINKKGYYFRLYSNQFIEEQETMILGTGEAARKQPDRLIP